ncbi:hypothetical protein HDU98_007383, partial [Podochytrium sp. JEL0797]
SLLPNGSDTVPAPVPQPPIVHHQVLDEALPPAPPQIPLPPVSVPIQEPNTPAPVVLAPVPQPPSVPVPQPDSQSTVVPAPVPQPPPAPVPQPDSQTPVAPAPVPQPDTVPPSGTTSSANVLISGSGSGTYYYDVNNAVCPGAPLYPENQGYTSCEPSTGYQTLASRNTNFIVALAVDQMNGNKANLCGKRVVVKHNGQVVPGTFVVWDSCAACTGGVKLDFSLSALQQISSDACFLGVVPGVSWEVTDEQVIPYVA